jgi:hypothetical protein
MFHLVYILLFIASAIAAHGNPKDALIKPRGQKVCMQQCGTSALICPEAFWKEQFDMCYRCCATWGETVIKIECGASKNETLVEKHMAKDNGTKGAAKEKDTVSRRDLGFS